MHRTFTVWWLQQSRYLAFILYHRFSGSKISLPTVWCIPNPNHSVDYEQQVKVDLETWNILLIYGRNLEIYFPNLNWIIRANMPFFRGVFTMCWIGKYPGWKAMTFAFFDVSLNYTRRNSTTVPRANNNLTGYDSITKITSHIRISIGTCSMLRIDVLGKRFRTRLFMLANSLNT